MINIRRTCSHLCQCMDIDILFLYFNLFSMLGMIQNSVDHETLSISCHVLVGFHMFKLPWSFDHDNTNQRSILCYTEIVDLIKMQKMWWWSGIHPNIRNVTPFLIFRNPREWICSVQVSLLIVTLTSRILHVLTLK